MKTCGAAQWFGDVFFLHSLNLISEQRWHIGQRAGTKVTAFDVAVAARTLHFKEARERGSVASGAGNFKGNCFGVCNQVGVCLLRYLYEYVVKLVA